MPGHGAQRGPDEHLERHLRGDGVALQREDRDGAVAAEATSGWVSPPGLRQFVPATVLGSPDEGYRVTPVGEPSAPTVRDLAHANALAVVGEQDLTVHPGQVVHCLVLEG